MRRLLPLVLSLAPLAVACIGGTQHEHARRVWEMEDHETDLRLARDAIVRGDLSGARQHAGRLAVPDPVPGLPDDVAPRLAALRASGAGLASASSLDEAAALLAAVTAECSACHTVLDVPQPTAEPRRAVDHLWQALAWDDMGRWERGVADLGDAGTGLAEATTWEARRRAMATALTDGTLK